MPEFVFMLTHDDATVQDAFEVYDEVRDTGLHFIGFKDVGLPFDRLKALTEVMHEGGREVMLEVVSEEGGRAPLGGGGPRPRGRLPARRHPCREVTRMLSGTGIRYPFPGRIVGHPSLLRGSIEEITQSAVELAAMDGVGGLDLLAYRHDGDVERLVRSVVASVEKPVIAAGSVDSEERYGPWPTRASGASRSAAPYSRASSPTMAPRRASRWRRCWRRAARLRRSRTLAGSRDRRCLGEWRRRP